MRCVVAVAVVVEIVGDMVGVVADGVVGGVGVCVVDDNGVACDRGVVVALLVVLMM